ncbi:MAG TPA: alternative ribosome rescue aminoacyl-tRNA hydrolase ArfB [Gemmatimonadaceae bacterium]|nr:alternative ribosome rescue aminoacyl-tRNA hydrolase ArfB [Gemmatimonadaceae bacterium]
MSDALEVNDEVSIPRDELSIRASRSGGAGGQHVNTSSTRIELLWNIAETRAIPEGVREGVLRRLASRTNADGVIRIVSSEHRSQLRNRQAAEERLVKLVRSALTVPRARRKTGPTRASKEKRLESKKRRAEVKKRRASDDFHE